jgi:hypothetical protein
MPKPPNFTLKYYFHALTKLLGEPRKFFSELPQDMGSRQPLGFLCISSLIFAGGSLMITQPSNRMVMGGIFFINAVGMAVIAAGVGYMVMTVVVGRKVTFGRFFGIYALASGVTLLASWIPFFMWLTEPWKWWLIGTGMVKNCGLKVPLVLVIIGVSVGVMFLFFCSLLPIILSRK